MLRQVKIDSIPFPIKKLGDGETLFRKNLISIKHMLHIRNMRSIDAIKQDSNIQVLVAFMYHSSNPKEEPITISVSPGITSIEILNHPMVQLLPYVFNDVRVVVNGNEIINIWVKNLLDEAIEAFKFLQDKESIDLCIKTLLRKDDRDSYIPINQAYKLTSSNNFSYNDIINLVLKNKLFMFLITQCIRNGNYYGIGLSGWKKEEIENERYFYDLASIFKNVYILGSGKTWESTNLIMFQPLDSIVHCLVK